MQTAKLVLVPILKGAPCFTADKILNAVGAWRQKGKTLCYTKVRWAGPGYKGDFGSSLSPWSKGKQKASGWVSGMGNMGRDVH